MIMPTGQSIFQAVSPASGLLDPRVVAGLCLIGLFGAISWRLRKTEGLVGFGLLWFLLLLLPSTALVVLDRGEPMAEHRVYTASIGLFLAVGAAGGWLHGRFAQRRPALLMPLGVVFSLWLVLMGGRTVLRNQVWSDPVGLWTEALDAAPDHWLPHLLLGEALQGANRCDEAVPHLRTSLRLHPVETTGYRKLGACLIELGHLDEARAAFEGLRRRSPHSPPRIQRSRCLGPRRRSVWNGQTPLHGDHRVRHIQRSRPPGPRDARRDGRQRPWSGASVVQGDRQHRTGNTW